MANATHRNRIDPFRAAEIHREALFDRQHWQPEPVTRPKAAASRKGFFARLFVKVGGAA